MSKGGALLGGAIGGPLGLLGGGMAGGMGGLGGQAHTIDTTSTTNSAPWAGVQPYLLDQLQRAQALQQQPAYGAGNPNAFLAAQSPFTLQAQQMAATQAQDPNSLVSQAQNQLGATISGQYLNPGTNPAWAPMAQRITDAYSTGTAAQTDAAAARANALGGSGYNQQTQLNQRSLGDSLAGLAGNLYNTERGNQLNALGMAPGLQTANISQLAGVGGAQDAYAQAKLGAAQQAYMSPWSNLQMYKDLISGTGGGTSTTNAQQPYFTNPWATLLGLGAGGLGIGKMLGMGGGGGAAALAV